MGWTVIDLDDELVACVAEAPSNLAQAAIVSCCARPLTEAALAARIGW